MKIFAFEGTDELYVTDTLTAAAAYFEAIDVANNEFAFYGDDGSVIRSGVRDGEVVLTPTGEKRPEELRERLRTFLANPRMAVDPALADDPLAVADLLIARQGASRWPRWMRLRRSR